jgi:hypothetical protein
MKESAVRIPGFKPLSPREHPLLPPPLEASRKDCSALKQHTKLNTPQQLTILLFSYSWLSSKSRRDPSLSRDHILYCSRPKS